MDFDNSVFHERRFLFQNIASAFPNNPWVIKATEKMKTYSKEEYKDMLVESYELQTLFDSAINKNISAESKEGYRVFLLFIKHIEWFFPIDSYSYNELIELCKPNSNQFLVVNKDYSEFLLDLLITYRDGLGV